MKNKQTNNNDNDKKTTHPPNRRAYEGLSLHCAAAGLAPIAAFFLRSPIVCSIASFLFALPGARRRGDHPRRTEAADQSPTTIPVDTVGAAATASKAEAETAKATAPVIRRGRGTFSCRLRMEESEAKPAEERAAVADGAGQTVPQDGALREGFDQLREAANLKLLLYKGEKKRRYCVMVGDLAAIEPLLTLTLEERKGPKPARLQKKRLRLIKLAVVNPALAALMADPSEDTENKTVETDGEGASGAHLPAETSAGRSLPLSSPYELPALEPSQLLSDEVYAVGVGEEADGTGKLMYYFSAGVPSCALCAPRFTALTRFFEQEAASFLAMEDVRHRTASIRLRFGSSYCCSSRSRGSFDVLNYKLPFTSLVQQIAEETMDLYFLPEAPGSITLAVRQSCGEAYEQTSITIVKVTILSEDGDRRVARACWNPVEGTFRVLDMETFGVALSWTVFSLDYYDNGGERVDPAKAALPTKQKRGYPFEVEMRSFPRWKENADHPSRSLLDPILDLLAEAERTFQQSGKGYSPSELNLVGLCQLDYGSEEFHVESIAVEHTARKRVGKELLVDTTSSLLLENFAEARRIANRRIRSKKVKALYSTVCSVHWKLQPAADISCNVAPMKDALEFVQAILIKANSLEPPAEIQPHSSNEKPKDGANANKAADPAPGDRDPEMERRPS
eukprot:gene12900-8760_t